MNPHHGSVDASVLRVARRKPLTEVLGPGRMTVIWVAGCLLRCKGCLAPETHSLLGGVRCDPVRLGRWVARVSMDGLTVSGGDPMIQSAAVGAMIDSARQSRPDLFVMLYTGYRLEWLRSSGSTSQRSLLDRVDLLVDGPYVERFHAPLKWRGSSNQRLIDLSGHAPELVDDRPAGLELELRSGLELDVTGVPPEPGFRAWADGLGHIEEPGDGS